jgi:quercetin dioxygenase-like cupin family protein
MVFGMGQLAPGEAAGWHEHPEPELFYVLEGTALGEWRDDDVIHQQRLVPGKAFFKAGWVPHRMTNDGPELFRGLFFKLESR